MLNGILNGRSHLDADILSFSENAEPYAPIEKNFEYKELNATNGHIMEHKSMITCETWCHFLS